MHTCIGEEVFEHCVRHRTCSCTTATPTCVRGWDLWPRHHCCCCAQLLEHCEHLPLYSYALTNMLTLTPTLSTRTPHTHCEGGKPAHSSLGWRWVSGVGAEGTCLYSVVTDTPSPGNCRDRYRCVLSACLHIVCEGMKLFHSLSTRSQARG